MGWAIEFKASVEKDLRKIDPESQERIFKFLREKVVENPKAFGLPLKGVRLWRYRVGAFRIICEIGEEQRKILVLKVGHRREAYRGI
ncbi:MAG: type II toxin-antitoxin system RelE/ParE family toxin [Syntrophobacteraceae bacterium]